MPNFSEELEKIITASHLSKMVGDKYIKKHKGAEFGVTLWGTAIDELVFAITELVEKMECSYCRKPRNLGFYKLKKEKFK